MSISCKHGHLRRQCELCDAEQEIATLTARLNAQCKLREEREQENDALAARVAELEARGRSFHKVDRGYGWRVLVAVQNVEVSVGKACELIRAYLHDGTEGALPAPADGEKP